MKKYLFAVMTVLVLGATLVGSALAAPLRSQGAGGQPAFKTTTPIKHLVIIYQENVAFDHYFGTYPYATNPKGEPKFTPAPNTPTVNGLTGYLLTNNPNQANPTRLDRSQALTCDMDHGYTAEQQAFDHGLMDQFVQYTSGGNCSDKTQVMDYFDGNTVTAMWNYAQHFALNDNSFGTTFGPSTPGAINLISGQTHGVNPPNVPNITSNGTDISDADPAYDACSNQNGTLLSFSGKNVGDLLNAKGITWGWFEGGFAPTSTSGQIVCGSSHQNIGGATITDYIPHHEPFQYYTSTANPNHLPPTSIAMIGKTDQANHQYDISNFWQAAEAGNLPAVSFLKAPGYQDGHAGYSDPLDEQHFLVDTINRLESLPTWNSTAVVINYDDSDGWYDHVMSPIVNMSDDATYDALTDPGMCGTAKSGAYSDRCGHGPRLPLLVISPYARQNFVDNTGTDQTSILRFIEDNWQLGRIGDQSFDAIAGTMNNMFNFTGPRARKLFLDPVTGEQVRTPNGA